MSIRKHVEGTADSDITDQLLSLLNFSERDKVYDAEQFLPHLELLIYNKMQTLVGFFYIWANEPIYRHVQVLQEDLIKIGYNIEKITVTEGHESYTKGCCDTFYKVSVDYNKVWGYQQEQERE